MNETINLRDVGLFADVDLAVYGDEAIDQLGVDVADDLGDGVGEAVTDDVVSVLVVEDAGHGDIGDAAGVGGRTGSGEGVEGESRAGCHVGESFAGERGDLRSAFGDVDGEGAAVDLEHGLGARSAGDDEVLRVYGEGAGGRLDPDGTAEERGMVDVDGAVGVRGKVESDAAAHEDAGFVVGGLDLVAVEDGSGAGESGVVDVKRARGENGADDGTGGLHAGEGDEGKGNDKAGKQTR